MDKGTPATGKAAVRKRREERLAEALRANLKRRKAAAKENSDGLGGPAQSAPKTRAPRP